MALANEFGARLRQLRIEKGMTQRQLAQRVATLLTGDGRRGFDFTYLSKIENGRLPAPSALAVERLAEVLEADKDELLALARKSPSDLGLALGKSKAARAFLRTAQGAQLSEADWEQLRTQIEKRKPR